MRETAIISFLWGKNNKVLHAYLQERRRVVLTIEASCTQRFREDVEATGGTLLSLEGLVSLDRREQLQREATSQAARFSEFRKTTTWQKFCRSRALDAEQFGTVLSMHSPERLTLAMVLIEALEAARAKFRIESVVVNEDYTLTPRVALAWARAKKIPSLHLAHGGSFMTPYTVHAALNADFVGVFGERSAEAYRDLGIADDRIRVIGNPAWDIYCKLKEDRQYVRDWVCAKYQLDPQLPILLFGTTWAAFLSASSSSQMFGDTLRSFLRACRELLKERLLNIVVKDHPANAANGRAAVNQIAEEEGFPPDRFLYALADVHQFVVAADVVVSVNSNLTVEAMLAGTPAINLMTESLRNGPCFDGESGIVEVPEDGLCAAIEGIIDESHRRAKIQSRFALKARYYNEGVDGGATRRAAELIKEISLSENTVALQSKGFLWERLSNLEDAALLGHYHEHARDDLLSLVCHTPRRVLDVGCAAGATGYLLKKLYPDVWVAGIELSKPAAEIARRRMDLVVEGRLEDVDFAEYGVAEGSIDTVVFADVLEHMYDPWAALLRIRPLLTKNAQILASIPNVRNAALIGALAGGRWQYTEEGLLDITHIRFFTYKEIEGLFSETGYRIVAKSLNRDRRIQDVNFFPGETKDIEIGRIVLKNVSEEEWEEYSALQFLVRAVPAESSVSMSQWRDARYEQWIASRLLTEGGAKLLVERMMFCWSSKPAFHVIAFLGSLEQGGSLAVTFDSLVRQVYRGWGLSVISSIECPIPELEKMENVEWIVTRDEHMVAANRVIMESNSDWIAVIGPGDELEPHALAVFSDYANLNPGWKLIYSDEDRKAENGDRWEPIFKPEFNLDLARSMPFVGRSVVVKRDAWVAVGGSEFKASANHDVALKVYDEYGDSAIGHISDILWHRGVLPWNGYLGECQREIRSVVEKHLARNKLMATVGDGYLAGTTRVVYKNDSKPLISIIVPNKDSIELLKACIESILEKTSYRNCEIIIVDNGSKLKEVLEYYDELTRKCGETVRVLEQSGEFNFSLMNNRAAREARGDYLVLLNNDTRIVQSEWIERMLHHAMRPEVGVVGARLVFPGSDRLQHAGVILGLQGPANHIFLGASMKEPGYMGRAQVDQEFSAVTAACMMVRKSVYSEVGGLDEEAFKVSYNDVDFCLRVRERGYKVVWTPYATVVHHGSVSQKKQLDAGSEERRERFRNEQAAMYERWLPIIASDPAYNVNLSLNSLQGEVEGELVASWDVTFHDRPRIMGQPLSPGASGDYRVVGPLAGLDRSGKAQTMTLWPLEGTARKKPRVPSIAEMARLAPDVLLMQSTISEEYFDALAHYKKYLGLFQVYDLEDLKLVEGIPDWNSRKRYLPKDMEKLVRRGLSLCDRLLVTTEPLAEVHRKDIDDIRVVPNYLDGSKWRDLTSKRRAGRKPRVGWAGAQQHHGDLEIVTSVVKETANEIEWVFFGLWPKELEPYIETHAFGSYEEYPARLASLNLDLAIAPLERNPFNIAKSNLRLLEYGILGIPVVCSDIEPYRGGAPVKRVANTHQEWLTAIRERIHDLDATAKEGDELREWVRNHWMLEDHLDEYLRALMP